MAASRAVASAAKTTRLPTTLVEIRRLFEALDWVQMSRQVAEESRARLAIVGPVNSGKSTLFNTLKGREVSRVGAVPGTTRTLRHEQWGPFTLTDTPGFGEVDGVDRASIALEGVDAANVILLVVDAAAGVRQEDLRLLQQLQATGKPVIVTLNKIDVVKRDLEDVVADARDKLVEPNLVPISARQGTNVARWLMPRLIDAHPALAVAMGRALPPYRRRAANKVVRSASVFNAVVGAEPVPGLDIPFLLAVQARMVLRIAAIFGEPMNLQHARELIATIVGGVALRYLAEEGAKLVPGPGWVIAAAVAAAGTWAIGQVAILYFEQGKKLSAEQMQSLYQRFVKQRRRRAEARSERKPRRRRKGDRVSSDWPEIGYDQARAAYEAGEKLHLGGRVFLVREALREPEQGLVLWVTDQRTRGDHGLLLYPDGRVEAR
jgi:small GTP-binding protein